MANPEKISGSYWDLLRSAERHLDEGDFPGAERFHDLALSRRENSPGRVFFSEKISDSLGRWLKKNPDQETGNQGRWLRHCEGFRQRFLEEGDHTVRRAVHLAELRPEDDAHTNQPILESALYLVGRSRIFSEEPASAVPLLKGLFRTARRTGRPFSVDLVRHDLPLTEEDRLWLARRGGELVVEFQEQGVVEVGSRQAEEWARVCLQLLNPQYFGQTGRLEEERSWVEAVTADHLLGRAAESVDAYRKYLAEYPEPSERADEARIRLLELLANIDDLHFQVPHYEEALAAMQSAGLSAGSAMAGRFEAALARMEHRRPDPEPGQQFSPAWASVALETDGRLSAVFWWGQEPRDVAYWRPGEDPAHIQQFLEPCEGRLLASHAAVESALQGVWTETPALWTARDFVTALLESSLPADGLNNENLLRIGMGETTAWRSGWNPDHGHVHLEPPRRSTLVESWQGGPAGTALVTGLLLLAVRTRLATADPCLRAGIRQLARRGDPASLFLYELLSVGGESTNAVDSAFHPWTLPLLWTRPDPFGWSAQGGSPGDSHLPATDTLARPDLGPNDLAIVSTGDPAAVVAAWGDGRQKWRIVLDRLDRLDGLSRVAGGAIGPVTLIPPSGLVHDLDGALGMLEKLLAADERPAGAVDGLLPLFHWSRLVETHNGDLLDFLQVRPRHGNRTPLYELYRERVQSLPVVEPRLDTDGVQESWACQFSQRVRKAGFVAGMVESLVPDPHRLDSLWGVFEGSDASWVFLDSATVHWSLLARPKAAIADLHALLHSRGHRHLSLLTGAVWLRNELEDLLSTWLSVYGSAYRVGLTDGRPPRLRLVDRGVVPDSKHDPVAGLAGALAYARQRLAGQDGGTIQLPAEGLAGEFWRDVASGELPLAGSNWSFLLPLGASDSTAGSGHTQVESLPGEARQNLLVPVLASLEGGQVPIALEDTPAAWTAADRDRLSFLEWRRRLCGLEMASLLAGTWQSVEILDSRWWRLLKPTDNQPDRGTWSGAEAAALVAPDNCTTFDLPGQGRNLQDLISNTVADGVRHWFHSRPDDRPPQVQDSAAMPPGNDKDRFRTQLLLGNPGPLWMSMVRDIGQRWERGELDTWALLIADELPGPAADLVASSWASGISAWPLEDQPGSPAPVLWIQKDDFLNPDLAEYLAANRPTHIVACGVQDWLPRQGFGQQVGAYALGVLLDIQPTNLTLQADHLPAAWEEFLVQSTAARVVSLASQQEPEDTGPIRGEFSGTVEALHRLRRLLNRLEVLLPPDEQSGESEKRPLVSARQLVSVRWLANLAGVPENTIQQGVRILRWAGSLQSDSLTAMEEPLDRQAQHSVTHAVLIPRRFAEVEHQLKRLENQLPVLLPLLLGHHRPGLSTIIDLAHPPIESEPEELLLLDSYLSMVAEDTVSSLQYGSTRGLMHTTGRRLGCLGSPQDCLGDLLESLALFRTRIGDIMAGAQETGEGFLVDTGLSDLRDEERHFLATGAAMGLWRWLGPVDEGSFHLVDLLTLAESPTVRSRTEAWQLLEKMAAPNIVRSRPPALLGGGKPAAEPSSGWGFSGLRQLLPGHVRPGDFEPVVERVAHLIQPGAESGQLILKGLMGSGRHLALARALARVNQDLEVTVYCPDAQSAASLLAAVCLAGSPLLSDIRIAEKGLTPAAPKKFAGYLGQTPDALVVMCEVQRFEKETRYRIAQMGRGCKLLMTVDPAANSEPWENLFLTTPRAVDIIEMKQARLQVRRLWSQMVSLMPEGVASDLPALRQGKGEMTADYAVNLDQCLARLVLDVESGNLPDRLRLVGPLLSDLDFLAESLRQKGWLAIDEDQLAALLLPGVREVLAVATDLLARGLGDVEPTLLTPHLLDPEMSDSWGQWYQEVDVDLSRATLAEFFALVETEDWARRILAHPQATQRALTLLEGWADESVAVLAETALWEAWWLNTLADLGLRLPDERRPLIMLAEASNAAGLFAPGCMYLCLGSEDWRQHYNVLGRATDQALILFKERSPLEPNRLP